MGGGSVLRPPPMAQHPHAGGLGTLLWYYQYTDSRVTISPTVEFTFNAHEDIMGSASYYTKQTGAVYEEHIYDAWGGVRWSTGHGVNDGKTLVIEPNYTGHSYDPILKIYHGEARFYDGKTRQWMASDPIKSGLNWYQYVESNPTTFVDYNGLWAVIVGLSASAAYVGRVEANVGIAFDDKGNVGLIAGGGLGAGLPSASAGGFVTVTNADSIFDLTGIGVSTGASIGQGWSVGADAVVALNGVLGFTISVTASIKGLPVPVEMHATLTGTALLYHTNLVDNWKAFIGMLLLPYQTQLDNIVNGYFSSYGCFTNNTKDMLDLIYS